MDFIITVCNNAADEVCPVWPGHPMTAHWGFEDPAAVEGTGDGERRAFVKIFRQIRGCVRTFVALPFAVLGRQAIKRELDAIGRDVVANP